MDYDEALDQSLTALQLSTEEFLGQLDSEVGTPAAAYRSNSSFYVHADASLRTIKTRAEAEPKSEVIVKQLQELQGSLDDLQGLHKLDGEKGLSAIEITSARSGIESEFQSLFALQLALKTRLRPTAPTLSH